MSGVDTDRVVSLRELFPLSSVGLSRISRVVRERVSGSGPAGRWSYRISFVGGRYEITRASQESVRTEG